MPRQSCYIFFLFLIVSFLSCSKKDDSNVLARVGDETIDREDFILNYELQAKPGARPRTYEDRKRFLLRMIENQLLAFYGMENGYAEDPRISHRLKAIEKDLLIKALYRHKVADQVKISEKELREGFVKAKTKIRARHLFVKTKEQADSLLTLLRQGYTFRQLSQNLFRDSTLAKNGGDLGYFSFGDMDEAFENAAYKLRVGEISEPVETRWGYHIIKLEDRIVSPILPESEFQTQKHRIERVIRERKETALANEYVKDLMKDKNVVVKADAVNFLVRAARKIKKQTDKLLPEKLPDVTDEEILSVQKDVENHLQDTVVEFAGGKWTLETFFRKAAESLPQDRPDLTSHLDIAEKIAVMVRNEFLLKEALAEGLDRLPEVRRQIRKQKTRLISDLVRTDIIQNIRLSEEDIQNYYRSHPKRYSSPEKFHLREIVLPDSALAWEIYNKIKKGEDFCSLAKKYSIREKTAQRCGDLGILVAPDHPQIAQIARKLNEFEVSQPFYLHDSYFLLQLIERIPPKLLPISEVINLVVSDAKKALIQNAITRITDEMRKKYTIKIYENRLKKFGEQEGDNVVELITIEK